MTYKMYVNVLIPILLTVLMLGALIITFSPEMSSVMALPDEQEEAKTQLKDVTNQLNGANNDLEAKKTGATDKQKEGISEIQSGISAVLVKVDAALAASEITVGMVEEIVKKMDEVEKIIEKVIPKIDPPESKIGEEVLKALKERVEKAVNIVKKAIKLLKKLYEILKSLLEKLAGAIGKEFSGSSHKATEPMEMPGETPFDNLHGFSTLMLPNELGGGNVSSDTLGGSLTISSYSTANPSVFNVSIANMDIIFSSVTVLGIPTGPNHVIIDPRKPRFSLLNITGTIWEADLPINGFLINNVYTSANPVRFFGVAKSTYDSTTYILNTSLIAYDFFPPYTLPKLTIFVSTPTYTPIKGASVSIRYAMNHSLVSTKTTGDTGKVEFVIPMEIYWASASATGYLSDESSVFILDRNLNLAIILVLLPVGGFSIPIDKPKPDLSAPYIGLASTILVASVATAIYVKRVKRRKQK